MTLEYMLDTDTVSYLLRGFGKVGARLLQHQPSQCCISSISLAELRFGAAKRKSKKLDAIIEAFASSINVMPFDDKAASVFGNIAAALVSKGTPIGDFDTLIAAHARSLGLILVTNNDRHFQLVKGLRTENWT